MAAFKHLLQEEQPLPRLVHQYTPRELCFLPIRKGKGIELHIGDRVSNKKRGLGNVKAFVPDRDPDVNWLNPRVVVDWDTDNDNNPVSPLALTKQAQISTGSIVWLPAKAQEAKILQIKGNSLISTAGVLKVEEVRLLEPITQPAYKQMGGKFDSADWINYKIKEYAGEPTIYVEPFGGSWSVGLKRSISDIEVYNDLDEEAVNFWQHLQREPEALISAIENSSYEEEDYNLAKIPADDPLEAARRFYIRSQLDKAGAGTRWPIGYSKPRNLNHSHLWSISCRINKLQIYNVNALEIIERYDNPATVFFIDWPNPWELRIGKDSRRKTPNRLYKYELTETDHRKIAKRLLNAKAKVFVCGIPGIDKLFPDWHKVQTSIKPSNGKTFSEFLWISTNCELTQEYENAEYIHSRIAELEIELKTLNTLSIRPEAWIETGKCCKRKSRQVYWRSGQPIFSGKKRQYIGMEGSDKHREAEEIYRRSCRAKQITSELEQLHRLI